jgi:hypothetical protein
MSRSHSARLGVIVGIIGMMVVLGPAVEEGHSRFVPQSSTSIDSGKPLDLSYIAEDFHAALIVHPRRILESRLAARLLAPEQLSAVGKEVGVAPKQVEQVILALDRQPRPVGPVKKPGPRDNWTLVDTREGEFQARFPAKPKQFERNTPSFKHKVFLLELEKGKYVYEIYYYDLGETFAAASQEARLNVAMGDLTFKPGFKGKKDILLDKRPGAEIEIDDRQLGAHSVHHVCVVGKRVFRLSVTSRGKPKPEERARFFDSFHFTDARADPANLFSRETLPLFGLIIRFNSPVDRKTLISGILQGAREGELQGKKVYRLPPAPPLDVPMTAHLVDEQTLLLAPDTVLKKMLTAKPKGPLVERLKVLGGSFDVGGVLLFAPYQDTLNEMAKVLGPGLPPPWKDAAPLAGRIDALHIVGDLRGKHLLTLTLEAKDREAAQKLGKVAADAMGLVKETAPIWRPGLSSPAVPRAAQKDLAAIADQIVSGPEVQIAAKQVQLMVARPVPRPIGPVASPLKLHTPREDREEIPLHGEVIDVVSGGGGRFLIYQLRPEKKLQVLPVRGRFMVLDLQEGKIVKEISVSDEPAFVAAGAQHFVVVTPRQKKLILYSLNTLEEEKTVVLPPALAGEEVKQMCMGPASLGPVYFAIAKNKQTLALDLASMTTTPVGWKHFGPIGAWGPTMVRVSPSGRTLLGSGGGWAGLEMLKLENGRVEGTFDQFAFSGGAFANISADDRTLYFPGVIAGPDRKPETFPGGSYQVPAAEPGFFLALKGGALPSYGVGKLPAVSEVTLFSDSRMPLLVLKDLAELKEAPDLHWEKTVHYYPSSSLLITLAGKNKVVLRRLDLDRGGADYLFVMSRPAIGKLGAEVSFKLDIRSKRAGVKATLLSGPEGLKVAPEGQVTWAIPVGFPHDEAPVSVSIRDDLGQEIAYQFVIRVMED